jgi:putative endonuclease
MGPRLRDACAGTTEDGAGMTRWVPRMCYVYMLASRRYGTLYIGVTNDLRNRLEQHRLGLGSKFVKQYAVHRLVWSPTRMQKTLSVARSN